MKDIILVFMCIGVIFNAIATGYLKKIIMLEQKEIELMNYQIVKFTIG